jgi:PTH1 family peptidyl-tRNA hydrolase
MNAKANNHAFNKIKLVIGLGNPGADYKETYHNVGVAAVEWVVKNRLKQDKKFEAADKIFQYLRSGGLIWIKPLLFMNESGLAVSLAAKRFNIKTNEILVIHDDSDLALGRFKIAFGRGSAGHKGVESVIKRLGTKNFWRLRIGVRPSEIKGKASNFILKKISARNKKEILAVFKKIAELPLFAEPIGCGDKLLRN